MRGELDDRRVTSVLTRSFDNARTGSNTTEAALTATAIATGGVRRLHSLALPGDARGIEAQPLVVSGVTLGDGSTRDVMYLATMANQVWALVVANGKLIAPTYDGRVDVYGR